MTGEFLLRKTDALDDYLRSFDDLFGRSESREHFRRFARGQLGTLERKSLEPMADAEGVKPRALQLFFSQAEWDHDGARDRLQGKIAGNYGSEQGVFLIDETSDAKKGEWTAGVARQYCGESGKIDNCIVTVHLAYAQGDFHALLDGELFLPECWNPDPNDVLISRKRKRAEIPDRVVHEGKAGMALIQLERAVRNGMPGRWVCADEGYGGKPWWRWAVAGLKLQYVVEVPKNTMGWTGKARPDHGKMRPGRTVEGVLEVNLRRKKWERFCTHDTEKGPDVWEVKAARFWEQGKHAPELAQWLIVARNVRTQEVKYFLSNAPEDTLLRTLVRVAFSRWHVERCFQDCKTELGLNHAEIRSYKGMQRHLTLTAVNYYFLQDEVQQSRKKKNGGVDREPVGGCVTDAA